MPAERSQKADERNQKKTKKWNDILCPWGTPSTEKASVLPRLAYRLHASPIKTPAKCVVDNRQHDPRTDMEKPGNWDHGDDFEKEQDERNPSIRVIKNLIYKARETSYIPTVSKTGILAHRLMKHTRALGNRPHRYSCLTFYKNARAIQRRKDRLLSKWRWSY